MNYAREIDSCLRNRGTSVTRCSDAAWELTLCNGGAALPVRARLSEDWLQLDAEPGREADEACLWQALEWNGMLEGVAKFALVPPGGSLHVRAEIPLDDEMSVDPDLGATLEGFTQASSLAHGGGDCVRPCPVDSARRKEAVSPLRELVVDAGWEFTERPGGKFAVDLESGSDFRQSLVEAGPRDDARVSVELARWESPVLATRKALAVLLLTAAGVVRMARPAAEKTGDGIAARFEFRLAPPASPVLLGRGLAALSVACRICGREAAILNNERIAGRYLAVRRFAIA